MNIITVAFIASLAGTAVAYSLPTTNGPTELKALPPVVTAGPGIISRNQVKTSDGYRHWNFAPKPPMGWNSYDAFGDSVTEAETLANASYMREKLLSHGWNTIVIDFRWYDPVITLNDCLLTKERAGAKLTADQYGRLLPSPEKFPSAAKSPGFQILADRIHSMGLKFGFHMMRGIPRQAVAAKTPIEGSPFTAADAANTNSICGWCPDMYGVSDNKAGQAWYDSCARLWASWGLDFVKVDDLSVPYSSHEIEMLRKAIDKCGRPIVLSTSPGPTPIDQADHIVANANMWRISADFWDDWKKLDHQFDLLAKWSEAAGPGHWPDADMIPFGHIGIRNRTPNTPNPCDRWTRYTPEEQRTLLTLWCLAPSPLMLGMNLPDLDSATLSFLSNDDMTALNQDPLGKPATRVRQNPNKTEVWIRDLSNGSKAVGLFNRGDSSATVSVNLLEIGLQAPVKVRDLWFRNDLDSIKGVYTCTLPPHGSQILKIQPETR
jgi:hypothetical protein